MQLVFKGLLGSVKFFHFLLFSQDFLGEVEHAAKVSLDDATAWVFVLDVVDDEGAVFASSEEVVIVKGNAHAFNAFTVSLHFSVLLKRRLPDLNGTWSVFLADTSEERLARGQVLHLRDDVLGGGLAVGVTCAPNVSIITDDQGVVLLVRNVAQA